MIRIIEASGREVELNLSQISSDALRTIVGGWLEFVSVLDEATNRPFSMIVNETGVVDKLPRNQKATDIYLAYSRRRFPGHSNPAKAMAEEHKRSAKERFGADLVYIEFEGHSSDPYIAGDVVLIPVPTIALDSVIV